MQIKRLFICLLLLLIIDIPAFASEITVFQRDLYDRITINNAGEGDIVKDKGQLSFPITNNANADIVNMLPQQSRIVDKVDQSDNRIILNLNDAVTETRNFKIGNRIIIDIFFDADRLTAIQSEDDIARADPVQDIENDPVVEEGTNNEPPLEEEKIEVSEVTAEPENNEVVTANEEAPLKDTGEENIQVTEKEEETTSIEPIEIEESAPALSVAEAENDALAQATTITINSTTPFGMGVFERFGRLFIVTDQPNMAVPPQLTGVGAELGWEVNEIPMNGGSAWMIPIPENAYIRPEGRGLIWRLIISDINPDLDSADIRRQFMNPNDPVIDILMQNTATLLRLRDPDYLDDLAVITASRSESRLFKSYDFVDFNILPAIIGAVVKPESDGIRITAGSQFISINKTGGLNLSETDQDEIVASYLNIENREETATPQRISGLDRIYYFDDWGGGVNPEDYNNKRKELDQFLMMAPDGDKLSIILDLVKLTLSQSLGAESFGFLDIAEDLNEQIADTSEYMALRGAAHFIAGQYDIADDYLSNEAIANIAEVNLWAAATKAAMGDEGAAVNLYNDTASLADIYPIAIRMNVLAPLALAHLNEGQGEEAAKIIDLMSKKRSEMSREHRATVAYLKGRAQSITGRPDEGISNLYKASMADKLGPYGIRSEMLLIQDELTREVITIEEAINRMERLRFAWRGDGLETEIQIALGELYIQDGDPRKGLNALKRAATNTGSIIERRQVVRLMADAFKSIFIDEKYADIDPMVAVATYDEFKELTPVGDEGNRLIDALADRLMAVNLMSRATNVLKDKMNRLGEGRDAIQAGLRIASIQLLDREPEAAYETLNQVDDMVAKYRGEDKDDINQRIVLLKARALAKTGNPKQALFMTEGMDDTDDVIRLRIDTAWRTGEWVAVTDNLSKLLARQDISAANPPDAEQAQLILNQAVALSLSDQYDALQRFASRYDAAMKQTALYKQFLVVTRPQNISNLADRDTLLDVTAEVDLFDGVLERVD
jgi:hypothetical protein